MAILGQFKLTDYTTEEGYWKVHLVNNNPGGGNASDYYVYLSLDELTATTNQTQLANMLKERLAWSLNQTFGPLNTAIANNMTITLP